LGSNPLLGLRFAYFIPRQETFQLQSRINHHNQNLVNPALGTSFKQKWSLVDDQIMG